MVTVKDNYHAVSREIGLCVFVFYVSYVYYALLQSMYFAFLRMHAWHSSLVAQAARAAEPWQGFLYTNPSRQTLCQWHSSRHIYVQTSVTAHFHNSHQTSL